MTDPGHSLPIGYEAARRIAEQIARPPRLARGAEWAEIAGALAERLSRGESIDPDPTVIRALREMELDLLRIGA